MNDAVLAAGCSVFPNVNVDAGGDFTAVLSAVVFCPKLNKPGAGRLVFPVEESNVNGFVAKNIR